MKPIQTIYKGYAMRSRLEARWAVFFDNLGLSWTYEPEGFDLGEEGWYLPDFWINDLKSYIEIKPRIITQDQKAFRKACYRGICLHRATSQTVLIIIGEPWFDEYKVIYIDHLEEVVQRQGYFIAQFAVGRKCDHLFLSDDEGEARGFDCYCADDRYPLLKTDRLMDAYLRARQFTTDKNNISC